MRRLAELPAPVRYLVYALLLVLLLLLLRWIDREDADAARHPGQATGSVFD